MYAKDIFTHYPHLKKKFSFSIKGFTELIEMSDKILYLKLLKLLKGT